jgi:Tol biopolymer transport system component
MRAGGTPPQPFTQSGSDVAEFAASPDGNNVAYVVDTELWLQTGTEPPKLLARLNSFAPAEADFSMDNIQLAYVDERSGIWVVTLAENAPQLVLANGDKSYRRPQFAPDGLSLLLDVYGSAGTSIGVLDLTTRDLIESLPMTDSLALNTRWLRDGQIYTYSDAITSTSGDTGFYIINSASLGAQPTQWIPTASNITVRAVVEAVDQTLRVVLAEGTEAFAPLRVIDFDLAGATQTPILDIGSVIAPNLSPDGRFVGGYESLTQIDGIQQGAITVVDLLNGQRFVLSSPAAAWGFRWGMP